MSPGRLQQLPFVGDSLKLIKVCPGLTKGVKTMSWRIPWWATDFGEAEANAVRAAVMAGELSQGRITEEFECEFSEAVGLSKSVATTSGSAALSLALYAAGIRPGDEVIVPTRSWIATAHSALLIGAVPVFADVLATRPVMDPESVRSKITARTRAIIPVMLNGRRVAASELRQLAQEFDLRVIIDAAQALGSDLQVSEWCPVSPVYCFSLSVAKVISTGQGGVIASNDSTQMERIQRMRTHGLEGTVHVASWLMPGMNGRFTDMQASIGLVQLKKLRSRLAHLDNLRTAYSEACGDYLTFLNLEGGEHGPYVEAMTPERSQIIERLAEDSIEVRPFYPDQDRACYLRDATNLKNSRDYERHGIYLPSGPSIGTEVPQEIADALSVLHR